jgi:hypothetical protein
VKINRRSIYNFANKRKVSDMNLAYFKHDCKECKMLISFRYVAEIGEKKLDRNFNFARNDEEKVEVALNRIKSNLEKELKAKSKKKKNKNAAAAAQEEEKEIEVETQAEILQN